MKSAIAWVSLAMLALGMLVGALTGLSESPVAGVVIPLLFGVLGGANGFFILRCDFSERGPTRGITVFALSVFLLAIGTGLGMWWGVDTRTSEAGWSVVDVASVVRGRGAEDTLDLVLLDARLLQLGLSRGQRMALVASIQDAEDEPQADAAAELRAVAKDLAACAPPLEALTYPDEWRTAQAMLGRLQGLADVSLPLPQLVVEVAALELQLRLLDDDADERDHFERTSGAAEALARARRRVILLSSAATGQTASLLRRLDSFLDGPGDNFAVDLPDRSIASTLVQADDEVDS